MKISIDTSVIVGDSNAIGRISGHIELTHIPSVGDTVSFLFPTAKTTVTPPNDCNLQIKVEEILFMPQPSSVAGISLMLENLVFSSEETAKLGTQYFEQGFDLFFEEY
jgi:hypothetical protein